MIAPVAPQTGGAVFALTRIEAVRLLRHPVVLLALVALAAWWLLPWILGTAQNSFPVLHEQDQATAFPAMVVGFAALVAANRAVLRAHRHGTEELYGVRLVPRWGRTAAHLLAVVPLAVLVSGAAIAHVAALSTVPAAVGRVNPAELATAPALVLLLGASGVLLGRLVRSPAGAPLAVVLLLFGSFAGDIIRASADGSARWLGLVGLQLGNEQAFTPDLLARPAGWHALYLVGLALFVAGAVLLRDRGPWVPVAGMLVVAVLGTVVAGSAQLRPLPEQVRLARVAATEQPASRQTCVVAGGVKYCMFAGYEARVAQWQPVVEGVRKLMPPQAAQQPLTVRQRVAATNPPPQGGSWVVGPAPVESWRADDLAAGTPGAVSVSTTWRPGSEGRADFPLGLAYAVAARAVGTSDVEFAHGVQCGGRAIVALWLAASSRPDGVAAIKTQLAMSMGSSLALPVVDGGQSLLIDSRDVTVVQGMLGLPTDRVQAQVHRDWAQLTGPGVRTADIAARFGLPEPPPLPPVGERSVGTEDC
ncbi:hypothetical protein FB561_1902 [Kribbella amoyensis]|uniref:Uncharacterized protein n=1 Tax=Kribbella amoyensis TaxID=996641 RepID=A0A561BPK7_9ACTN|nr:hypothetical protein [Kribbella amoyensis]TWD80809.1 hypothetical protein FB561_1902 [Kribbella amoyensis]